jgi:hypothetical protein
MVMRIVTSAITTGTALLLSRSALAMQSSKPLAFQLCALLQVALAFVGLMILPFVALTVWNDYVDFQAYSPKPGLFLLLLPTAAVIFCLTRGGSSKNRQD